MKVCLVSSPTASEFDPRVARSGHVRVVSELAPIGVLTLAAILDRHGIGVEVVDLNRAYYRYLGSSGHRRGLDFCSFVAHEVASRSFDVCGLSTICSTYPLTIRIAREVKKSRPECLIVLGGPQASAVDVPSLQAFPFIDCVVRGEADETLPLLLDAFAKSRDLGEVPGVTFRRGENVIRNPDAPLVRDLDKLPMPAFHLYPELGKCKAVPLEIGRGCPFGCTFCSTNVFFRRHFRLKSAARVVEQMLAVHRTYGNTSFKMVHDMFTADRKRVVEFCEALLACGERFQWTCSARTDCIDNQLIALMARAGCVGIFLGIETGSPRLQPVIKKNLDLDEAAMRVRDVARHGIGSTVSLITGFPEENRDDLRKTVAFLMDAARVESAKPQLHLLGPLAGAPIYEEYRHRLERTNILSDFSDRRWSPDSADQQIIRAHPDVFPSFSAIPTLLDRQYIKELRDFIQYALLRCRWLLVALHHDSGDLLQVFDAWRKWLATHRPAGGDSENAAAPYYATNEFREDILKFVRSWYLRRAGNRRTLRALLYFELALQLEPDTCRHRRGAPRIAPGVRIIRLGADYHRILDCLRNHEPLAAVPAQRVVLAVSDLGHERLQVSRLSPLSAQLLTLCNGNLSWRQIARRLRLNRDLAGIPRDKVCAFGLETLRQSGLVEFS